MAAFLLVMAVACCACFGMVLADDMESDATSVSVTAFICGFAILPVWAGGVVGFALMFRDVLMPFWAFWLLVAGMTAILTGITCLLIWIPTVMERNTVAENEALFRCPCGMKRKFVSWDSHANQQAAFAIQMSHHDRCEIGHRSVVTYYK